MSNQEEKYREIIELLPDIVYEYDLEGNMKFVNKAGLELFGYTQQEFDDGLNVFNLVHPSDRQRAKKDIKAIFNQSIFPPRDYMMITKEGKKFPVRVNSRAIKENGKTIGMRGIARDISESKEAEKKIKESEEKYRHLFESSPYGIWIVNPFTRKIIDCNETFNHFLSIYTHEDMIGKKYTEALSMFEKSDYFIPMFRNRFRKLLKNGYLEPIEFNITKADGTNLWVTLESTLFLVDGQTRIQVIIKDITQRKKAELLLKASEAKYRNLFEKTPFIVLLLNSGGVLLDYNSVCEEQFFKDFNEDQRGKNIAEIIPKISNSSDNLVKLFQQKTKHLSVNNIFKPVEVNLTLIDGRPIWMNAISSVIEVDDDILIQTIIQDITEKKLAELELKESQEALKMLNKQLERKVEDRTKELRESKRKLKQQYDDLKKIDSFKNDFIAMATHELKTPLSSIFGYTDFIITNYQDKLEADIIDDLNIVQKNIERLRFYINQLLDVMEVDEHELRLNKEKINIKEIILNCVKELQYLIKEKRHYVEINVDEEIVLELDKERMYQVISNLLSNSIKFTNPNGRIEIETFKNKEAVLVKILDTGRGFSKKQMSKIFSKFEMLKHYREKDYHQGKGTGLGLYIVKGIIEAHGGTISVESEGKNKGSIFIITLPLQ